MKFVVFLALVAFVAVTAAEEFKCEPEVPYKANNCNGCFCTPASKLACTMMECLDPGSKELKNCVVGTTSEKDCNKCWCVEGTGTICTAKKC